MISWIQKYFQRHFRLVFIAVLLAVGLPMIVIYSSSGGGGGGDVKVLERPFFGVNLANQEQARRVFADGELSSFLRIGYSALQGAQLEGYSLQRIAGLAIADNLHLPAPSAADVEKYVPTLRAFQNQQGQFDHTVYTRFADALKPGSPMTAADVNRVLRDDVRLNQLTKIIGGPGYVLPADIKLQLSRIDATWTVQIATLDYPTFNPAINPTEEALKKFHEENSFRYDVPARPRLSYVEFKAADFVPPGAPTEAELLAFYNSNPSRFPVPADADKKDALTPATTTDNFPKVRDQVDAALRNVTSRRLASQAANNLTVALYERKATIAANSPELAAFLTSNSLRPVALAPFAPGQPPADKPWLANYNDAITRLTQERYYSDPLATPDGMIVLIWNESLPAYKPLFPEIREQVNADFRASEKRRLFIERGNALKAELQNAAKTPGGFAEKAATEKLEVKTYANFSLRQRAEGLPEQAMAALAQLEAGQVSDLVGLDDKGILVYAQEKKLPDLSPTNPRYAEVRSQLMTYIANNNENAYLSDLVAQEIKKTNPAEAP